MDKRIAHGRRHFIQRVGALSALGLGARLGAFDLVAPAQAQSGGDYRALVCVFLYGGNDGNNTVLPFDPAGYAQYAAVRSAASGIQLPQASLLPIQPANAALPFGLHPSLPELQALFNQRKLAIVANVGTLVQPITKAQYLSGVVPLSLYSHSDQQSQWQSSVSNVVSGTGWGGRIADKLSTRNAPGNFPVVTSLNGSVLFATGRATAPLSIPVSGAFALSGYSSSAASTARLAALKQFQDAASPNQLVGAANAIGAQAIALSATMGPILANANSAVAPLFAPLSGNTTASALLQVAKTIEARDATGARGRSSSSGSAISTRMRTSWRRRPTCSGSWRPRSRRFLMPPRRSASQARSRRSRCRTSAARSSRPRAAAPTTRGATTTSCSGARSRAGNSTARTRRWRWAASTTPKAGVAGYRRPPSTSMARRSRSGSA